MNKFCTRPLAIGTVLGVAFALVALSGPAFAAIVPTDGAQGFVAIQGTICDPNTANTQRTCLGTENGAGFGLTEISDDYWGNRYVGGAGSFSANALKVYLDTNAGTSRASTVMQDTYTLSGTGGPVSITAQIKADVIFDIGKNAFGTTYRDYETGAGRALIGFGTAMDADGTFVVGNDVASQAIAYTGNVNNSSGTAQLHYEYNLLSERTITVTPGEAFNLAYYFVLNGNNAFTANGLNTALIDFILPGGSTLTSANGWTSPSAISAIPLPPSAILFGTALLGLAGLRRRKRKAA